MSVAEGPRPALEDDARAWLALDPDPETRAEVQDLLDRADEAGLQDRFGERLVFGTAGLRGALGAGPNRMNRVVVQQTSAGLAAFLRGRTDRPTAVVGYDGRRNSRVFAEDAVGVLRAAGVETVLLPRALPTPVLAFAVRDLDADAGVMITASHNPAPDNGYKLYLGGPDQGSQLVAPADAAVLAEIERVVATGALPARSTEAPLADEGVVERYVAATAAVTDASGDLDWVYTPMHGVGLETVRAVLAAAGLPAPAVVAEQAEPDAAFPTAPFPNPEEPGTLDLATALAERTGATLILANDPDADRLAVAIPDGPASSASGRRGWRRLTGNDVGLLLAWRIASGTTASGGTLACSVVSTPGLARIAERFGLLHTETLTGFKWISRAPALLFGFEEALGYLVDPEVVRDKDGISALVAVLAAAIEQAAEGRGLADLLAEIEAAVGRFDSAQVSLRVEDLSRIAAITASLRADPPAEIGGFAVESVDDLAGGSDDLPPTDALRYRLTGGARVIVRPSGTEPKLKVYLDVVSDVATPEERRRETDAALAALRTGVDALLAR
ncbi:phospho-sugar mutase [Amnibacterium endophyticum]|uniref:Phospho-sugar mutase n=1 Tax=Amnibacterium endophyticum TaxID=2109337 RepID=A0ABW4LBG5_9MICO